MVGPLPAWCLTHIASNRLPTLPPAGCWSTQRNHWIVPTTLVLLSGKGISPTSQELYTDSVLERSRAVILLCSLFFFTQFRLPLSVGSFLCSPIGWPPSITNEQKKTKAANNVVVVCIMASSNPPHPPQPVPPPPAAAALDEDAVAAADKEMEERANRAKDLLSQRYKGLKSQQVCLSICMFVCLFVCM